MKKKSIFIIILFAFLSFGVFVYAVGAPTIIGYQGRLTDSNGDLLGGSAGTTYYFKFSIWNNSAVGSGSRLWPSSAPNSTSATVTSGVFNINIGDTDNGYPDALNYDFNTNSDIFLQVEVSSDDSTFETLSPRQRISSASFSQLAGEVSGTGPSSFGVTTPATNAIVTIDATATTDIPLIIRAFAGQVADLFQVFSSAGTKIFSFTDNGSFVFGNGFYLKQDDASTTTMYDPTDAIIIQFDTGQ